jgi:hypothetical protein
VRNIALTVIIIMFCFTIDALSKDPARSFQFHENRASEKKLDPIAGETGLAIVIKNVKLPNHKSKTFGEAVDSYRYFSKTEWKETSASNGKYYVDFTGWLKKNTFDTTAVSARGVGIKFLVKTNGSYGVVMVSKVELKTDGNYHSEPMPDISSVLNKLYGNIEIKF